MAVKPISSRLADNYQTYPTAGAAAIAALRSIDNKKYERGGGVLYNKAQNTYAATEPVGQDDGSHLSTSVGVPQGWSLHSTYHTHPSGPRSTQFSDDDVSTAKQLQAPSYVLALADNKVRMFDPATSKILDDKVPGYFSGGKFSNGSIVDETPPPPLATQPSTAQPSTAQPPTVANTPDAPDAAVVPVTGSRITMKDFADRHRTQTTKYKHKIVHIK